MSPINPEEYRKAINDTIKIPRTLKADDGRSFGIMEWNPHCDASEERVVITVKMVIHPHAGARRQREDNP